MISQKRITKLATLMLCMFLLCAALAGCGGGEGKVNAPFENSYCNGKDVDSIMQELREAGFTNIQTEPQETNVSFNTNHVISVKIGSNTMYNTANAWKADVPIIIKYYEFAKEEPKLIEVFLDISVSGGEGMPEFVIHTNLPDETVLSLELALDDIPSNEQNDFFEQMELSVNNGMVETEAFSNEGKPLIGDYSFGVAMLPSEQPEQIQNLVGKNGENLTGSLVADSKDYRYVITSFTYHSPVESNDKEQSDKIPEEEMTALIEQALAAGFGENYSLILDGAVYTASVWQDGLAATALLASNGIAESVALWNDIAESTRNASASLQKLLDQNGHGDNMAVINILNDLNSDNVLLSAMSGIIITNCVS